MKEARFEAFKCIFGINNNRINWSAFLTIVISLFISRIISLNPEYSHIILQNCIIQILIPLLFLKSSQGTGFKKFIITIPFITAMIIIYIPALRSSLLYNWPPYFPGLARSFIYHFSGSISVFTIWYYLASETLITGNKPGFYLSMYPGVLSAEVIELVIYTAPGSLTPQIIRHAVIAPVIFIILLAAGDMLFRVFNPLYEKAAKRTDYSDKKITGLRNRLSVNIAAMIHDLSGTGHHEDYTRPVNCIKRSAAGPVAGGIILLLMALFSYSAYLYMPPSKREAGVIIPVLALALLYLIMAICCLLRKIKYTYYFILLTIVIQLLQDFAGPASAPHTMGDGIITLTCMLGSTFLFILPFRSRDFGFQNKREFFSYIFIH